MFFYIRAVILNIILPIAFFLLSVYAISRLGIFRKSGFGSGFLITVFSLKCIAGGVILYMYNDRYEDRFKSDVYKFYDDSEHLLEAWRDDPVVFMKMMVGADQKAPEQKKYYDRMENWHRLYDHGNANDNPFMIKYNGLLRLVSNSNIWVHMIVTNFLVMLGLIALLLAFGTGRFGSNWLLGLVLILPSVLFWNSAMLKESFALCGLGFTLFGAASVLRDQRYINLLWLAAGLFILLQIKIFLFILGLPVALVFLLYRSKEDLRFNLMKYAGFLILLVLAGGLFSKTGPGKERMAALVFKQQDFKNVARGGVYCQNDSAYIVIPDHDREVLEYVGDSLVFIKPGSEFVYVDLKSGSQDSIRVDAYYGNAVFEVKFDDHRSGSMIHVPDISTDFLSVMKVAPNAWFNTIIRPLPLEFSSLLINLSALENMALLTLLILTIFWSKGRTAINWNLLFALIVFILLVYLLIGITTPVLGAIVRYRAPILPFVVYVCFILIDESRIDRYRWLQKVKSWMQDDGTKGQKDESNG